MIFEERVDMAHALFGEDLVDCNQDTCLLDIAKTLIDGRSKEFHGG